MNFDVGPKKIGKKPVLTDKKKPKAEGTGANESENQEELMTFDTGKKATKKPVLTDKSKPKNTDEEQKDTSQMPVNEKEKTTPDSQPKEPLVKRDEVPLRGQNEDKAESKEEVQDPAEPPKKGYDFSNMKDAFPPGAVPDGVNLSEMNKAVPLDQQIKSSNINEKLKGLKKMMEWTDPDLTRENFLQGLHLTIKEKDNKALTLILEATENIFKEPNKTAYMEKLNIAKLLESFAEKTLVQAKGPVKKKALEFIP